MTYERRENLIDLVEEAIDGVHDINALARQYAEAATDAILAALPGMVVPLAWEPIVGKRCSRERAPAFGGEYQIVMLDPGPDEVPHLYFEMGLGVFMFRFELEDDPDWPGERRPTQFPSVEAAKAQAQADYTRRIMSALGITFKEAEQ